MSSAVFFPLQAPPIPSDTDSASDPNIRPARPPWIPRQVLVSPDALRWDHGKAMVDRAVGRGCKIVELSSNRVIGLKGGTARDEYVRAKTSLAILVSPIGARKLQPIPPSADWQFHIAEGCPAHCQYCYLAGSLSGPPITRVFANLPEILVGLPPYLGTGKITSQSANRVSEGTTFEVSCYTDPLGIEHITHSLAACISHFGQWSAPVQLRFTTKFDQVDPLLSLRHAGKTRVRFSVNAQAVARNFEGGTASMSGRFSALRKLALAAYPVGLTIAPIMPVDNWRDQYTQLLQDASTCLQGVPGVDLSVELITHRFTPKSKLVQLDWYPKTTLDLDENSRSKKMTKFGSTKFVYPKDATSELRAWFYTNIPRHLPTARILYWT